MSSDIRQGNDGGSKDTPASEAGDDNEFEVEAILGKMTYRKAVRNFIMFSNGFNPECYENSEHCKYVFHVKWRGYDDSYNTWEVEENLANNITYMEYKKKHNMSEEVEKESFSVKDYLIECYRNKRHPLSDEVRNHVKSLIKPTIIRQSISRSSITRTSRKSPIPKEKKKKSDTNMADLFGESPEHAKKKSTGSMADLFGKSPDHSKRKSSEHNKSPPRKKPLSSMPSKEMKERGVQQTPKKQRESGVSSPSVKSVATNPCHSEKAVKTKTSSTNVEPSSVRISSQTMRKEERKDVSQKGDSVSSDVKQNIHLKEGTTSSESRSADIDQTMKKNKLEKARSSNSMWISATEKERELERKRKIVEARESARLDSLDRLEMLDKILAEKKKKKRELDATEHKQKKRDKSHDEPSTSSSVDNLSFSRREKEHQKIRNDKKAAESSSIFSDTDLFDRGSEEAGSSKKIPVATGIPVTSRPVGAAKRFSDVLSPVPIPKPQAVTESDRAKIKQLAAQRPVIGKAKTIIPNQRSKTKSSMSLFNLPKIPKKVPAPTTSSVSEASVSKPQKTSAPPKASSSLFDVDDIMSSMDKTIKQVPSTLPTRSPAMKPPPVVEKAPHLMLKSSQKPKREQKVPKFNYISRPRLSEESPVPHSTTTDSPMPVTKKAHSTSELFDEDVLASTSEPFEPLTTKAKGKQIQKPPRTVKETSKVDKHRVLRQLNQPFYPVYHAELFRKLGLLDPFDYSDDVLGISKWISEADAWSIYNNIVTKFCQRSRAAKSIVGMHVCKDDIRVLMNWDEKENVWKIFPGRASKRLMNAFAKKGVPTELGTKAAPPPFVFRVSPEAIEVGKGRKHPLVDLEYLEDNIKSLSIHPLSDTVKEESIDNKVGNPYKMEPLDGDYNSSNTNGLECLKIALCKIINQTSLNISDLVIAYKRLESNRIEEILTPISSALNRFHIIRELIKWITPSTILSESTNHMWLFESDLRQKNNWLEVDDVCCHQKMHGKCRMLKTLIQLLPEKLRFHSESPFNHGAFMHSFIYGAMCQKEVFFDAGVPLYLSDFQVNEHSNSLGRTPFLIDHFLIVVCQGKPWQIIQMLLKGCCVNTLPWRRTFDNTEINSKETEPASIKNLLSELFVDRCHVMAPSKADTIYSALWIFSARLQSYVMDKLQNVVVNHYEGLVYEAALTPVHTMRSVGPSQTANALTCILHGTEENNRLWSNFCTADNQAEEDDIEGLPTEWYNSLDAGTILDVQQDLGALVVSVFRVNFTGGVFHSNESNSMIPLDVTAAESGSCTPLSIGLTAIGPTLSRPSILLENPEKISNDEWIFKFGKDELAGLPPLLDQRVLLSLDTEGPIGVKFLVQLHLLLQEE